MAHPVCAYAQAMQDVRTYCGAVIPRDATRWPARGTGPIYSPVCGECNEAAGVELDELPGQPPRLGPGEPHRAAAADPDEDPFAEAGYGQVGARLHVGADDGPPLGPAQLRGVTGAEHHSDSGGQITNGPPAQ